MQNQLKGLILLEASVPVPWERVASLRLGVRASEAPCRSLQFETMGRYSNLVLADEDQKMLACGYQVPDPSPCLYLNADLGVANTFGSFNPCQARAKR